MMTCKKTHPDLGFYSPSSNKSTPGFGTKDLAWVKLGGSDEAVENTTAKLP